MASAGAGRRAGPADVDNGYQPREIRERCDELAPCWSATGVLRGCSTNVPATRLRRERASGPIARGARARTSTTSPGRATSTDAARPRTTPGALRARRDLLPFDLELNTVTGYDRYDRLIDIDLDFSPTRSSRSPPTTTAYQVYQDVALAGELRRADAPIRWEIGGWCLPEELDVFVERIDLGARLRIGGCPARLHPADPAASAATARFAFDFWDDFTLDGGVPLELGEKDLGCNHWWAANLPQAARDRPAHASDCDVDETWQAPTGHAPPHLPLPRGHARLLEVHARLEGRPLQRDRARRARASTIAEPEDDRRVRDRPPRELVRRRSSATGCLAVLLRLQGLPDLHVAAVLRRAAPSSSCSTPNDAEVYGAEIDARLPALGRARS